MPDLDSPMTAATMPPLVLPQSRRALARHGSQNGSLRITAFGSSTTEGIGASSTEAGFTSVMRRLMLRQVPEIVLSNRGIGGNNAIDLHRRLDDVIADAPDLVLFQTGSNDPLQGVSLERFEQLTRGDLARLKAETGADIVLIDQQLCRMLEECEAFPPFLASLHRIGEENGIPVFPRYRLMQTWCQAPGQDRDTMSPDGLHMGDHGYALLGAALADWLLSGLAEQS
jgi:acyl-CoA thioesterase-1